VHEPSLAIAIIGIALFGHLSWSTNIHTAISDVSPPGHVAILYGITGAAGTLMGAVTQPLIGLVVDLAGHETGYNYVFAGVGAAYLLAILLLLSAGRLERIRRPAPGVESPPTFPAK
jgi:ACS family hexuronate transporter-like MFS transporter